MKSANFIRPKTVKLTDHEVELRGTHLKGKKVALLVTGGIAAMKAPLLARELRRYGAEVVPYVSTEALRYTAADALSWAANNTVITSLTPAAEHLNKAAPFDLFLVAPATYNAINKMRFGIADTPISTTLATAMGLMEQGKARVAIIPTMHGDMHNSILSESVEELLNRGVDLIEPKDAYGKHNLPDIKVIAAKCCRLVSSSVLKGKRVLVTGGPTPVKIDSVRRITNKFRGQLAIEIANELFLRGAEVDLILGSGSVQPPDHLLPFTAMIEDYEEYKAQVLSKIEQNNIEMGLFSAAVADYQPTSVFDGKISSKSGWNKIDLRPTEKVIDIVREQFPHVKMVSFKFEINIEKEKLFDIGRDRISKGHSLVVLNRGEDLTEGNHTAYIMNKTGDIKEVSGDKRSVARDLITTIELNI
ncbi:MAG: bifunctional phosphopantothenoylcysteine decarboxylase/phosphopantothenate--cysteine ligase CoaBC [Bdellovibrionales bacterium CG10_big_fil_rev_8_21_14_0_10_45_34]|nr:MAG: bifunctional phosphopantothenoylcysteine decarboxylase/phosphopantothenate--cysteine ligase CoaBC [Bdellovibrionales bacterium CG10_big_fil_rev_8_21_14_0_10_45_34]